MAEEKTITEEVGDLTPQNLLTGVNGVLDTIDNDTDVFEDDPAAVTGALYVLGRACKWLLEHHPLLTASPFDATTET